MVGVQNGVTTLKTAWKFLAKLNMILSYNPVILIITIYLADLHRDGYHIYVCVCVCICIYIYVGVCVCVCIYT